MNQDLNMLVKEAISGNKNAIEQLIKNQQSKIYAMLFYLKKDEKDIKDLAQEVLLKLTNKIHQLKNPNNFKTWLNQIIINSYYDYLRKNKKYKNIFSLDKIDDEAILDIPDYSTNPSDSILKNELDFVIKTSINNLPIQYKIPITLREIQGLSYSEISNITKTSLGTVKSRIARARAKIKDNINRYSGIQNE